jgi:hypothetical protein
MSDKETSWILSLIDRITKPVKSITAAVKESTQVIDKNTDRVVFNEKQTKEALINSKKYYKDLQQQIKENAKEVKELQKAYDQTAPGTQKMDAAKPLLKSKNQLEELKKELKEAAQDIQMLETDLAKSVQKKQSWQGLMTGANQTMEIVQKVSGMMDFANPIMNTRTEIRRMTSAAGKELDELVAKTHRIGKVFNENDDDIARTANTMQKTWGGSYQDMIKLLESGYEKGANINNKLLSSMQQFPAQMKELGLSAKDTLTIIANADISGTASDKALAAIKEADESLKYLTKKQIEALKGINISAADLRGKTSWDAIKLITEKMKESNSAEARQAVLSSIFKSAGEDAGMEFIMGLSSIDLNIENLPNVQQAGAGIKGFLANIQSWAANTFGGAVPYIQAFGQASTGILGVISLFQALSKVTWIQAGATQAAAAAQRVWNVAIASNPIGAVLVVVAALGTAVYGLSKHIQQNSESWKQQQAMMELNEELDKTAIRNTAEKTTKIKLLTETAANEKLSLDARRKALNQLIEIDSKYRSALQDGIIKTDVLRKTTAKLTEEIYNNARAEAMRVQLVKVTQDRFELESTSANAKEKYQNSSWFQRNIVDDLKVFLGDSVYNQWKNAEDELEKKKRQQKELLRLIGIDEDKNNLLEEINGTDKPKKEPDSTISTLGTPDAWFAEKEKKGKKGSGSGREKNGMSINGGGSGKTITQHLTVNNYFTRTGNSDDRSFADRIITQINDGLRDAVATI